MKILVTGATGYIGGRLVPRLLDKGYQVVCMVRNPDSFSNRWDNVTIRYGDVQKPESLVSALEGVDIVYYMIHSMSAGENVFTSIDKVGAKNFADAAKIAGVKRIIYLGGLGNKDAKLSPHLSSRQQTGEVLRESGIPVTEFRAGVIVGAGSISFEIIRYLTERVPIMLCPKWVNTRIQPIAIRDILQYLIETIALPNTAGNIYEIGGKDVLTYGDLMKIYAEVRNLKRVLINVPFLTPRLSSYWVDLVTPIPKDIARPLILGLKNEVVVTNNKAQEDFAISPISYREAVTSALDKELSGKIETIWSNAESSIQKKKAIPLDLTQKEGMFIEKREILVNSSVDKVFSVIQSIGGKNGWYANILWQFRGLLDRLVGGVGMRRGRRDQKTLRAGDPLDFWRVESIEVNSLLRLRAEMKLPGNAWLQFSLEKISEEETKLIQTAFFEPRGLFGLLYWYSVYPFHGIIFSGMIKQIARRTNAL